MTVVLSSCIVQPRACQTNARKVSFSKVCKIVISPAPIDVAIEDAGLQDVNPQHVRID